MTNSLKLSRPAEAPVGQQGQQADAVELRGRHLVRCLGPQRPDGAEDHKGEASAKRKAPFVVTRNGEGLSGAWDPRDLMGQATRTKRQGQGRRGNPFVVTRDGEGWGGVEALKESR